MEIIVDIEDNFKSIRPCNFTFPGFCVLTGKNGSGKSHLLEALTQPNSQGAHARVSIKMDDRGWKKCHHGNIKRIPFGGLNPNINDKSSIRDVEVFIQETFDVLKGRIGKNQCVEFLNHVSTLKKIPVKQIQKEDLWENFDVKFMEGQDFFSNNLSLIFKYYARRHEQNFYNRYRKEKGFPVEAKILTEEEFQGVYGPPPWDLVNSILERLKIPYRVNNPINDDRDAPFLLSLESVDQPDVQIKPQDLSTGEKVLVSLALAIYNADHNLRKPDLLLLDEPDAGLHPSMSKYEVSILREDIFKKLNIPVIITTHSPTTLVALEGEEIYEKDRGVNEPRKVSKQEALHILTEDIPYLTVAMNKRRTVFVESSYDVFIYNSLFKTFYNDINLDLSFVQFKKDKDGSNCEDVKRIASEFFKHEANIVYGIVDGDRNSNGTIKNVGKDNLLVAGNGTRYAIENYILDPLLVALFLIIKKKRTFPDFSVTHLNGVPDIRHMDAAAAQSLVDHILKELDLLHKSTELMEYALVNGFTLKLSKNFCDMKGHDLEVLYKEKFNELKLYNKDSEPEKNLKRQILKFVVEDYPKFVSLDILNTLKSIH